MFRFTKDQLLAEVYENLPPGTYVKHVEIRSTSSCTLEIVDGDSDGVFLMNPSTGVISTKLPLDYEHTTFYNLTIEATNMVGNRLFCCCHYMHFNFFALA